MLKAKDFLSKLLEFRDVNFNVNEHSKEILLLKANNIQK